MRNVGPFDSIKIFYDRYTFFMTIIIFQNTKIYFSEFFTCEGLTLFSHFMDLEFKFGELGLTENGLAERFQLITENRKPFLGIVHLTKYMVYQ